MEPTTDRLRSEPETLERDARELHTALSDLIRVYQFRDRDRIGGHGVSVTQYHALEALIRRGAMTLNELAAALYLEKSTASRVVKGLERKGYVRRSRHPDDRRAVQLRVTEAARELFGQIEADLLAEEMELIRSLDPEIRQATTRLIARLARAAASRVHAEGGMCSWQG